MSKPLHLAIATIVLDGQPFIERHLPIFEKLQLNWRWFISHGAAMPNDDTHWVNRIEPRLSEDGTTEYLDSLKGHPNVTIAHNPQWHSKLKQVNYHLGAIKDRCVLMQIDADEIWKTAHLERIVELFHQQRALAEMAFKCRYFVGPNLAVRMDSDDRNSWIRAFRFAPGCRFRSHEPPLMGGIHGQVMEAPETSAQGLIFDHFAYANAEQVRFKEKFYGYRGALKQWKALQKLKTFPIRVSDYLHWANEKSMAEPVNAELSGSKGTDHAS